MPFSILFFGTSEFAVPSLEALAHDGRFEINGVVTQPDRPVGRHAIITPSPVKMKAIELGITTIQQPEKLKDASFVEWVSAVGKTCDAFVVVSYGKILPQWLLDLPTHGVVNVHGSILPQWRGAAPIQAAIAAGDTTTGVTIMKMDAALDHGPILHIAEETIHANDTGATLHDRLAMRGAEILPKSLAAFLAGDLSPREQDHANATTCHTLTRDDGKIDWTKTATELERMVRAYTPWPGTWTEWRGKRLKILEATIPSVVPAQAGIQSDSPLFSSANHLYARCGDGSILELTLVQLEGKTPTRTPNFL